MLDGMQHMQGCHVGRSQFPSAAGLAVSVTGAQPYSEGLSHPDRDICFGQDLAFWLCLPVMTDSRFIC